MTPFLRECLEIATLAKKSLIKKHYEIEIGVFNSYLVEEGILNFEFVFLNCYGQNFLPCVTKSTK